MTIQDGNQLIGGQGAGGERAGTRAVPPLAGRYPPQDVSSFLRRTGCRETACRAVHKFPVEHTVAEATIDVGFLWQILVSPALAITETRNAVQC
ncbi:hypothetical protein D1629_23200 (plasmid) [Pantoea agglomerans]|nr:hypothetical protein D1629_23200 [Pantoea agglomerans]QAV52264.1 hypothetical protein D1628_23595 [Pantoea agglomerans]